MPSDRGLDMSAAEAALGAKRSRGMVKSVVGKTLINAELIFNAGVRTLPISAGVIGQKSTEVLKKKISRKSPPASKPGEPPRKDTGDLIESIQYNVMKSPRRSATTGRFMSAPVGGGAIKVVISANTPYAQTLEFGKKGKGRGQTMSPRPFFRPTFQNVGIQLLISSQTSRRFVIAERFAARKRGTGGLR